MSLTVVLLAIVFHQNIVVQHVAVVHYWRCEIRHEERPSVVGSIDDTTEEQESALDDRGIVSLGDRRGQPLPLPI